MRGDLLRDLLSLELADEPRVLARARAYGHDLTRPHVVLVVRPDAPDDIVDPPSRTVPEASLQHVISCTRSIASSGPGRPLVASQDGAVIVLWPADDGRDTPMQAAEAIRRYVASRGSGQVSASVAIGDRCETPMDYRFATRLATGALRMLQEAGVSGRVIDVQDLGMYRLLLSVDDPVILRSFADRVLGALHRHDRARNADFVRTLRTFIEHDQQQGRTAAALHVHPNTLAYRLRKIETITGLSLRTTEGLLETSFALAIERLLQGR
jgi:sugar diacid utilization regulator